MSARRAARLLATARILLGAAAIVAPRPALTLWVGDLAEDERARLLGRVVGARDVALGLGALLAVRHDTPVRGWVEAGMLADTGDALSTLVGFRAAPTIGRWAVLGASASAVAAGGWAARAVDAP